MARRVEVPPAIQWFEGMLLAPQHFQHAFRRQEALLHYHAHLLHPFHWGVRRLRIDQELLPAGLLRISELEAVLPDGLLVTLPPQGGRGRTGDATAPGGAGGAGGTPGTGGAPAALELSLDAEWERGEPTRVWLVVRRRGDGSPVLGEEPRYRSVPGLILRDENTDENELEIPNLEPHLRLRAGTGPPLDHTGFPIAEVGFDDDKFVLTDFVPPLLPSAEGGPPRRGILEPYEAIVRSLRSKAQHLARTQIPATEGPQLQETKLFIHALVSRLPTLDALSRSECHPFDLYLALCGVAGDLAIIRRDDLVPPELPRYDHNEASRRTRPAPTTRSATLPGCAPAYPEGSTPTRRL